MSCAALPRLHVRPLTFQLQRHLQLVKAAQSMLQTPGPDGVWRPPSWPQLTEDVPVLIEGGSFGGYVAVWCAVLFPEHFHGAFSSGAPATIRRYVGEQEAWRYLASHTAQGDSGKGLAAVDFLQYPAFLWQYQEALLFNPALFSPLFHTSATRQFQDNRLHRPLYFVISDEDSVSTGTDSLPLFDGARSYHDHGSATTANGTKVFWSVIDKRCHAGGWHTTAIDGTGTWEHERDMLEFLKHVVENYNPQSNPTYPAPTQAANDSEDGYDHVYTRGPYTPATSGQGLMLDASFTPSVLPAPAARPGKSFGIGTWLGHRDSGVIRNGAYYVGSAEGIVTRLTADAATLEFVPQEMSVALGYGAWALGFGELGYGAGEEIVVGTHRQLHILDANLNVVASRQLEWEQSRPLTIQVADVYPDQDCEILVSFEFGEIAVFDCALNPLFSYGEPGVVDFIAHDGMSQPSTGASQLPISILSERGHVASVTLGEDGVDPDGTVLHASSVRMNGNPVDLETVTLGGQTWVAAMYNKAEQYRRVRLVHPLDMSERQPQVAVDFNPVTHPQGLYGLHGDLEVVVSLSGTPHFVMLIGGSIYLFDATATGAPILVGKKDVASFAPAVWPLDISVGELHPGSGSYFSQEIAISTQPGYVVWFPLDCLLNSVCPDPDLPVQPGDRSEGVLNGAPKYCNRTLAATWGMTSRNGALELVDQSGSRWRVSPSGDVTLLYELMNMGRPPGGLDFPGLQVGPIRDLRWVGTLADTTTPDWRVETFPGLIPGTAQRVLTNPWTPVSTDGTLGKPPEFGDWRNDVPHYNFLYDGFMVFPEGGDVYDAGDPQVAGSTRQVHWWAAQENDPRICPNLLQGLYLDAVPQNPAVLSWWASVTGPYPPPPPSSLPISHTQIDAWDLRNVVLKPFAAHDSQSLRLFQDPVSGEVLAAVSTPGGSLIVMHPGNGPADKGVLRAESADYGSGGMALAVRERSGAVDIYMGVIAHHAANTNHAANTGADPMVGAVKAFTWTGSLDETPTLLPLDAPAMPFGQGGFGVCGLAVGQAIAGGSEELVVTTLDGHLLVYQLGAASSTIGSLVYATRLEGARGAFNSIVIEDLELGDGKAEVYVASSLGIYKFIQP